MDTTAARPQPQPFSTPESREAAPTKARIYFADTNKIDRYGFYNSGRYAVADAQKFE